MKTVIGVAGFLILLALVYWGGAEWAMSHRPVSESTYQKGHAELKDKIDSLAKVTKTIEAKEDTILANIDTLKKGQEVIFDEVKKTASKSFFDMFKF